LGSPDSLSCLWALKHKRSGGRPDFGGRLVGCFCILLLSAGETKLLNNIVSHAVIKCYTYFACCFNYHQLFWALLSDPHRFSASLPRHPETSTSPVGLYSAGLTNQCAWGSASELHACVGFHGIKKVEKHWHRPSRALLYCHLLAVSSCATSSFASQAFCAYFSNEISEFS